VTQNPSKKGWGKKGNKILQTGGGEEKKKTAVKLKVGKRIYKKNQDITAQRSGEGEGPEKKTTRTKDSSNPLIQRHPERKTRRKE